MPPGGVAALAGRAHNQAVAARPASRRALPDSLMLAFRRSGFSLRASGRCGLALDRNLPLAAAHWFHMDAIINHEAARVFKGIPRVMRSCQTILVVVVDGVVPMGIYPLKFSIDAGKERVTVRHGRMGTVSLPDANKVGFPSGQREQTVNLPAKPSEVQILPPPPLSASTSSPGRCRALTIGRVHR